MMEAGHETLNALLDLAGQNVGARAMMLVVVIFVGSGLLTITVMALSRLYGWIWERVRAVARTLSGGRK